MSDDGYLDNRFASLDNLLAGRKPVATQANPAPNIARIRDITCRNSSCSRLLRLPPEIRNIIWTAILGERTIHIGGERDLVHGYVLWHTVCEAPISEYEAYEDSKSAQYDQQVQSGVTNPDMRRGEQRHKRCYETLEQVRRHNHSFSRLDLAILRTCHLSYDEANGLLYSSNTWSFKDKFGWDGFLAGRFHNGLQFPNIQKIHLDNNLLFHHVNQMEIYRYPVLQVLHLDVRGFRPNDPRLLPWKSIETFFSAKKYTVICNGETIELVQNPSGILQDALVCTMGHRARVDRAEKLRQELLEQSPKTEQRAKETMGIY